MAYRDSYGPEFTGPRLTPWVKRLLIGLTAAFLALFVADDLLRLDVTRFLVFAPAAILRQPWSVLTFPFVERNALSLLFVLLTVYFFAGPLEERWGAAGFLRYLAVSALGGVLLSVILAGVSPRWGAMPLVGFTGAIYGMLMAFALYWPEMEIRIWGIIPVKAKWLALASAAIGFIISVQAGGFGLAHLGAFGTAFAYLRSPWAPRAWGEAPPPRTASRKPQSSKAVVPWAARKEQAAAPQPAQRPVAAAGARRGARAERELLDDVDRILDKISAQGLSSLTEDERKRLDEVSRRYRTN
ncbi:MAG TPA: rhomboid family intramembrane serine protease [Longimicrobium sp.]|nr:rhomboid family intramembrane serine protease [Longimicrobium sp.]